MNDYLRPGIPLDAGVLQLVGAKNTPLNFQSELTHKKAQLQEYLASLGIDVPLSPNPNQEEPRHWLVRGTSRISSVSEKVLLPQSGQLGTRGVFFGECMSPVILPDEGIVYVYPNSVTPRWLNNRSRVFQKLVGYIAAKNRWDTTRIGEGVTAYETVYSKYPVFSPKEGICTIPTALPVDQAQHIIMVGKRQNHDQIPSLSESIRQKISFFDYD